jgi:hypothetical protein
MGAKIIRVYCLGWDFIGLDPKNNVELWKREKLSIYVLIGHL